MVNCMIEERLIDLYFFSCKVDILFGHNCGFQTLLVGTGHNSVYELNEVLQNPSENQRFIPDFFVPSLGDIMKLI